MSVSLKSAAVVGMLIAFTIGIASLADAEEKEQTCVKTNIVTANKASTQIGEDHELVQELSIGDMEYSNPDFKITSEWAYIQKDVIGGRAKERGYFVDFHEDGSQTYGAFEGTSETTVEPGGSWQANWQGTYKYVGGTGKFANIKGEGTYKGAASSTEPAKEECKERVEY